VLNRCAIILSDLHLGPTCPPDTAAAAARVIRRHPGHEVILLGDTFDLSIDPPKLDPALSVSSHLAANPQFREALRERLVQGTSVTLFAGNHDAQLAAPHVRSSLLGGLGLNDQAPLACGTWCLQWEGLHLEHGHMYDPDNAQTHPLVAPHFDTEPLGIKMMRNVLAPTNALFFAHAHELTPLRGLTQAFIKLGPAAPRLVTRYYIEALKAFARAKSSSFSEEELLGANRLRDCSLASNLEVELLQKLLVTRASPRHHRRKDVFYRLYLDRSIATALWWSSSVLGAVTSIPAFWGMTGVSLAFLGASLARGKNRYSGSLTSRLRNTALGVRKLVDARAVVFGHTHVEETMPGYVNNGSFAFGGPSGRTYLLLESPDLLYRVNANDGHEPQRLDILISREADANSTREFAA
jgi:hypothetical protein